MQSTVEARPLLRVQPHVHHHGRPPAVLAPALDDRRRWVPDHETGPIGSRTRLLKDPGLGEPVPEVPVEGLVELHEVAAHDHRAVRAQPHPVGPVVPLEDDVSSRLGELNSVRPARLPWEEGDVPSAPGCGALKRRHFEVKRIFASRRTGSREGRSRIFSGVREGTVGVGFGGGRRREGMSGTERSTVVPPPSRVQRAGFILHERGGEAPLDGALNDGHGPLGMGV